MRTFWEEESYPAYQDFTLVLVFTIVWPLARFLLDRGLYEKVGRAVLFFPANKPWSKEVLEAKGKTLGKFKESCWKVTYYSLLEAYAVLITYSEPWALDTAAFWHQWPNQMMKNQLKMFYIAQGGFYVYSVAALLFWETRRKDFAVMMTHHFVTLGLIAYSYMAGFVRVGSIVMALHDVSDVFLEGAKLCKYSQQELLASLLFACFALSWFALRLVYFPFWIIWSTSVQCLDYLDRVYWLPYKYYQFNTLLIILLIIHVYWWVLICRMIARQLQNSGKVTDDVRSDSDDD